jgi:hypothetical protein
MRFDIIRYYEIRCLKRNTQISNKKHALMPFAVSTGSSSTVMHGTYFRKHIFEN